MHQSDGEAGTGGKTTPNTIPSTIPSTIPGVWESNALVESVRRGFDDQREAARQMESNPLHCPDCGDVIVRNSYRVAGGGVVTRGECVRRLGPEPTCAAKPLPAPNEMRPHKKASDYQSRSAAACSELRRQVFMLCLKLETPLFNDLDEAAEAVIRLLPCKRDEEEQDK